MQGLYKYILLSSILCGCLPRERHEGIVIDKKAIEGIHSRSSQSEVIHKLGSPSFIIKKNGVPETWVYASLEKKWRAFFQAQIAEQHVIEIEFQENQVLHIKNHFNPGIAYPFFKEIKNPSKPS